MLDHVDLALLLLAVLGDRSELDDEVVLGESADALALLVVVVRRQVLDELLDDEAGGEDVLLLRDEEDVWSVPCPCW